MHLNGCTEQAERWIDLAAWDACASPVDPEALRGRLCFWTRLGFIEETKGNGRQRRRRQDPASNVKPG